MHVTNNSKPHVARRIKEINPLFVTNLPMSPVKFKEHSSRLVISKKRPCRPVGLKGHSHFSDSCDQRMKFPWFSYHRGWNAFLFFAMHTIIVIVRSMIILFMLDCYFQ